MSALKYTLGMPAPNRYNLRTDFDYNKSHNKGHTFGITSEAYAKVYCEASPTKKGWTEHLYNVPSFVDIVNGNRRKMTFGGRSSQTSEPRSRDAGSPGPGHYDDDKIEGINKIGHYVLGTHKNSLARNWSKGARVTEFNKTCSRTPGPGSYDDGLDISKSKDPNGCY